MCVSTHYETQAAIVKVLIKKKEKEIKLLIIRHARQLECYEKHMLYLVFGNYVKLLSSNCSTFK